MDTEYINETFAFYMYTIHTPLLPVHARHTHDGYTRADTCTFLALYMQDTYAVQTPYTHDGYTQLLKTGRGWQLDNQSDQRYGSSPTLLLAYPPETMAHVSLAYLCDNLMSSTVTTWRL